MHAALLDVRGVYLRMDEVEQLTEHHLPQITACDLPPGRYLWVPSESSEHGGAFWDLDWLRQICADHDKACAVEADARRFAPAPRPEMSALIEYLRARGLEE